MAGEGYKRATESSLADLNEAVRLLGEYPTMFSETLTQARLTKALFERWAWMGSVEIDLLNRVGGPEAVHLAQEINRIGKDL